MYFICGYSLSQVQYFPVLKVLKAIYSGNPGPWNKTQPLHSNFSEHICPSRTVFKNWNCQATPGHIIYLELAIVFCIFLPHSTGCSCMNLQRLYFSLIFLLMKGELGFSPPYCLCVVKNPISHSENNRIHFEINIVNSITVQIQKASIDI